MNAIELCERGLIPDTVARFGMRRLMRERLKTETVDAGEGQWERYRHRLQQLRDSAVAVHTDAANSQHYEVPATFFETVLGDHLKYSACHWSPGTANLSEAEAQMLALSCERADLKDGQRVLELGCGWGSLTLWIAQHYPNSRITAMSNSASQREHILERAASHGLTNVEVITCDVNAFETEQRFDRVVSVEMFEHVRNYEVLMRRIAGWLVEGGALFVHIFCHRELMYPFEEHDESDWMSRHFFTGGLMPAEDTLLRFQGALAIEEQWRVSGTHYERTANAWLENIDARRAQVLPVLEAAYGGDAARWLQRWRMFFMACAELFGYDNGREWMVAHYRFRRR